MKRICVDLQLTVEIDSENDFDAEEKAKSILLDSFDEYYLNACDCNPSIFGLKFLKTYED
jgi:hypothetical protein